MRALGYVSPFSVEGHERCEAIGICGEEYPMKLLSEFSCLAGLASFLLPSHSLPVPLPLPLPSPSPSTTSSSVSTIRHPSPRHLQSKGGDAHCSMISSGRPSNGGGVSRTRGAFSMLDRRASAGAEASSMALRYRWTALDTSWHVRYLAETRCVAKGRRENDCATAITTITTTETRRRNEKTAESEKGALMRRKRG